MGTKILKCSLTLQSLALLLTLITNGLTNNTFFAVFWVSTIVSLVTVLSMRRWDLEEWFSFAAITFSMVGGVLYAIRALSNEILIIILIAILLFMAGTAQYRKLCIMNGTRCGNCCGRKYTKEKAPQVIIVEDIVEVPVKKTATKKAPAKKKTTAKKKATKKKVAKKAPAKKKTTKKTATKKKSAKKVSAKAKKAKALSHGKYHKPKLPSTSTKKKTTKKKVTKKKTTTSSRKK